jgi:hypothetical protein
MIIVQPNSLLDWHESKLLIAGALAETAKAGKVARELHYVSFQFSRVQIIEEGFIMANQADLAPKQGESYRCEKCGMEIKVTTDCNCKEGCAQFSCCGAPLKKV